MGTKMYKTTININGGVRHNGQGNLILGESDGDSHYHENANREATVHTALTSADETSNNNNDQSNANGNSSQDDSFRLVLVVGIYICVICLMVLIGYGITPKNVQEKNSGHSEDFIPPIAAFVPPTENLSRIEIQIPSKNQAANPESVTTSEVRNDEVTSFFNASSSHKKELDNSNHLEAKSTSFQPPLNPHSIGINQNEILTRSQTNLYEDPVITTGVTIYRASNLPNNNMLNVTINGNQNWRNVWQHVNPDSVHSLALIGKFDLAAILYFITVCTNMEKLELSDGKYLCDQVSGDYKPTTKVHLPSHLQSLKLSSIGLPCENLYTFLVDRLEHLSILELVLKDVSLQYENIDLFQNFLDIHHITLEILYFDDVSICGNDDCALFADLNFPNLKEAKLYFSRGDMASCKKSLENFNLATGNIHTFESNVDCLRNERKMYIWNWKKLYSAYDVCHVI